MKVLSAITLFLLTSFSTTVQAQKQKHRNIRSATAIEDAQDRRRGKKEGEPGNDGGDGAILGDDGFVIEPGTCIPFTLDNGNPNPLVSAAIAKAQASHDEECNTNSCGSSGSPGCCRYHTNSLRCDQSGILWRQPCICNAYTAVADVPSPSPSMSTKSDPTPGGGSDLPGVPGKTSDDPNDECQLWNPDSDYWSGDPHPFQVVADASSLVDTCFAGHECAQGSCCVRGYCLCEPISTSNSASCLEGFEA